VDECKPLPRAYEYTVRCMTMATHVKHISPVVMGFMSPMRPLAGADMRSDFSSTWALLSTV
jgi:hypothetical protein